MDRNRVLQSRCAEPVAIKFTPRGGTIQVRADAVATDRGIRVSVENPGPGIAAADISRLFQRFQQLDASDTRSRGGTGLGLAIVKAIVELHGGSIGVESEPNVTTRFWFELPGVAIRAPAMQLPVAG